MTETSPLDSLSDDELVELAQVRTVDGKTPATAWEAWVVLYERHKKRILNIVLHILGDSSLYWDAVDLTDSSFTKALNALPGKQPGSFTSWLTTIAKNETLKWFLSQKVTSLQRYLKRQEERGLTEESSNWSFPISGKLEQTADIELRELIELAKNFLSNREYQIFVLHYEEGWEVEEIADKLNARLETVRQTLWRATSRFKRVYEGPRPTAQQKKRKKAPDGLQSPGDTSPLSDTNQGKEGRQRE